MYLTEFGNLEKCHRLRLNSDRREWYDVELHKAMMNKKKIESDVHREKSFLMSDRRVMRNQRDWRM